MNNDISWKDALNKLNEQVQAEGKKAQEQAQKKALQPKELSFAEYVGEVQPLKDKNQYIAPRACEYITPRHNQPEDKEIIGIFVGEDSESTPPRQYTAGGEGKNDIRKLLSGKLPIVSTLDLHGYRQDEAQEVLNEFIDYVQKRGVCAEIIHGSGLGSRGFVPTLKNMVRRWLIAHPQVMAYSEPNAHNDGAVLVLLKRHRRDEIH